MYVNKKYLYVVSVYDVYDDENVQATCEEQIFKFREIEEAKNFAIICMKHNKWCIATINPLPVRDKQRREKYGTKKNV